jgi:predicted NodU family carbamoyl transferase
MRIVGLSAFYHDSAAALIEDGRIVAAAQEERFTRRKHDARFPARALAYCLEEAGVTLDDVDYVAFYDKPFLKFERLLETYVAFAPRGLAPFRSRCPSGSRRNCSKRRCYAASSRTSLRTWTGLNAYSSPNTTSAMRHRPIIPRRSSMRWC